MGGTIKREAEQATYRDFNVIAQALNKWKNPSPDASLLAKGGSVALDATVPFTRTPINIIARGVQYSPAGILNGIYKWKSQKLAAEGIDELAKGLTGTGVVALGYYLRKHGILTGKANDDKDAREYDKATGNSPFSILGKYTYDWAQPFSVPLSIGVEIYEALKNDPEELRKMDGVIENNDTPRLMQIALSMTDAIVSSLSASSDTVFNMSILKGIKNTIFNQQGLGEGLSQLPQQYASQFVPTVLGQVAGMVDPTVRQTYIKGDLPASFKATLLNKIPFASKTLEPKQTPFGEDMKRIKNPALLAFSQFMSPGIISVDQGVDPAIDSEIRRLGELGFTKQFPTVVPNYIEGTKNNPKINLTPEEQTQYQKRVGQLTMQEFSKIINTNNYKTKSDEEKEKMLADAVAKAKDMVKTEIKISKGYKVK